MKSAEIIKDLIISILIVACIILVLSVMFYDKISLSKVVPEVEEYMLTEEMQEAIEEDNMLEEKEKVVTKYYIDAADLKKYEKTKEYNKGKKNPFAAEEIPVDTNTGGNSIGNNSSSITDNNESTNFYEDDGTK